MVLIKTLMMKMLSEWKSLGAGALELFHYKRLMSSLHEEKHDNFGDIEITTISFFHEKNPWISLWDVQWPKHCFWNSIYWYLSRPKLFCSFNFTINCYGMLLVNKLKICHLHCLWREGATVQCHQVRACWKEGLKEGERGWI